MDTPVDGHCVLAVRGIPDVAARAAMVRAAAEEVA